MLDLSLKSAASFVRTSKAPKALLSLFSTARKVITFTQERLNRPVRFVVVANAYRRGMPVREIETKYGCSKSTILRYARLAGLSKRERGFDPGIRNAVVALYVQGRPIAEISARLGVSQAYISKTATEEGINRRRRPRPGEQA
jgi:transposase